MGGGAGGWSQSVAPSEGAGVAITLMSLSFLVPEVS